MVDCVLMCSVMCSLCITPSRQRGTQLFPYAFYTACVCIADSTHIGIFDVEGCVCVRMLLCCVRCTTQQQHCEDSYPGVGDYDVVLEFYTGWSFSPFLCVSCD